MAASTTKKKATPKATKSAKSPAPAKAKPAAKKAAPAEINRFRANGKFVTSMLLDLNLHAWWSEECKKERRSFSALVNMLLERERARILKFREATAHLEEDAGAPLSLPSGAGRRPSRGKK